MSKEKKNINLHKIPKQDVYKVPEGYFETLPDRISQKIEEEDGGKERKLHVQISWKAVGYAAAASVALLVAVLIGLQGGEKANTPEDLLADVSTSDLVLYLQYSELDTYEIVESTDAEVWDVPLGDPEDLPESQLDEEDMDLLYERYGVSPDENLQNF